MSGELKSGDCLQLLPAVRTGSIPLICTDPPFNIGESYDLHDDAKPLAEYLAWCRAWMAELYRICHKHGSFWLNIGDGVASELDVLAKEAGFRKRSQVCSYYTFGQNSSRKLTPSHVQLFYYTKHKTEFTFNTDSIKIPSARQRIYGDKRAKAGGRLPDDTWILSPKNLPDAFCSGEDTWSVSRVCGTFKERQGTPNQMPEAVLARIIRLCSNPGDTVLDCFGGSGTTATVAKKLDRNYWSCELSQEYAKIAVLRLDSTAVGDPIAGAVPQGELHGVG